MRRLIGLPMVVCLLVALAPGGSAQQPWSPITNIIVPPPHLHDSGCDEEHPAVLELVSQIQEAIEVAYHNVVALVGAGYVTYEPFPLNVDDPTAPRLQHWINPWRMGDGRNLDPWRPESVLVDEWYRPIGFMFIADPPNQPPPPVYVEEGAGPDGEDVVCYPWHWHNDYFARGAYWMWNAYNGYGTNFPTRSPDLTHVWAVPNEYGVFSHYPPPAHQNQGPPPPIPWGDREE